MHRLTSHLPLWHVKFILFSLFVQRPDCSVMILPHESISSCGCRQIIMTWWRRRSVKINLCELYSRWCVCTSAHSGPSPCWSLTTGSCLRRRNRTCSWTFSLCRATLLCANSMTSSSERVSPRLAFTWPQASAVQLRFISALLSLKKISGIYRLRCETVKVCVKFQTISESYEPIFIKVTTEAWVMIYYPENYGFQCKVHFKVRSKVETFL